MNETELEKLIVRLVGDASSFIKAMDEAKKHAKETETTLSRMVEKSKEAIKKAGEHFTDFTKDIGKDAANRILGGFGFGALAGGIATGLVHLIENATEVAEKYEKTEIGLNTVLEGNHREVGKLIKEYDEFADAMDKTTTASHIQTLQLLKQAESHRLTGDAAKNAVKEAIALSTGGKDPEAMLRITSAVNEGNLQMAMAYGRLIPELRGIKNEEEYLIEYYHQVNVKLEEQNRLLDTAGEKWKKTREDLDRAEVGLGKVAMKMGEISLNLAKTSAGKVGMPWLNILSRLGESPKATVHITKEAEEILAEHEREENRKKAQAALAVGGGKDLKDWLDDLKEEVKYAGIADENLKRLAKDRDRLAQSGKGFEKEAAEAALNYERVRDALGQIAADNALAKAAKQAQEMNDKMNWQEKVLDAHRENNFLWDEELEKLALLLPNMKDYVNMLRERKELMKAKDMANKTIDSIKAPEEKLNERLKELDFQLKHKQITMEQYARAVEKAKKELLGMAAAGQEAVELGGEAMTRMYDYMEKIGITTGFHGGDLGRAAGAVGGFVGPPAPPALRDTPFINATTGPINLGANVSQQLADISRKLDPLSKPGVKIVTVGPGG